MLSPPSLQRLVASAVLALVAISLSIGPQARAAGSLARISWLGTPWYLSGVNMPYVNWRCDFGCGNSNGVSKNYNSIARALVTADRAHTRVLRWYLFPDDAWQIQRDGGNIPTGIASGVTGDMNAALRLAEKYDMYINFVIFSDTRTIPSTWISNSSQRASLAAELAPLIHRYTNNPRVIGWEIFNEPERGIDDLTVAQADVQATVSTLSTMIHAQSNAYTSVGPVGIDRIGLWEGLGLDFVSPHWFSPDSAGSSCAVCTTAGSARTNFSSTLPIVIGAVNASSNASTSLNRFKQLYNAGYAGAWVWSLYPRSHPDYTSQTGENVSASWQFAYSHAASGPHSRPLNPCQGPKAYKLRCPDLVMSPPSNLFMRGRWLLSGNSINNHGRGPAEFYGTRNGHFTMKARQRIHRMRGRSFLAEPNGARLYFKAIPGQYRYWKFRDAAQFELWKLDAKGRTTKRARVGLKHIYCLRDLKHTQPSNRFSPRHEIYPRCSQNLRAKHVRLGTSVGWSDVYPSTYHEQGIDVKGLRGCYAFVHVVDPGNHIFETKETNNRSKIVIRLPYTGRASHCPGAKSTTTSAPTYGGYY